MKVHELIELLSGFDPDIPVVASSDSEGNSFSPLAAHVTLEWYVEESSWSGDILRADEPLGEGKRVACLWPVN